ncbi:DUF808 domain-containing protein [Chryseobacterium sp. POL2]|uniref:DUF808 domain-containing protein n=1 Tax=Chryseobacterium sp. POL2 TaxID=2713414 RepID=UPI0013E0EDC3|nr:DUF808 domain-containing protein [Chryseobacterium sp. POL2]QIG88937.1 DUF808 domain-containing protein [Chryseobacterium sp. POL2]
MASGFFAILDDLAALMDDVAVASKVATQKTAGILGDDLAVNAEKATGFESSREIPVLWAITKGSFLNKLIIVPIALLLNAFFPIVIKYVLIAGGCYLAFEGMEKIFHFLFHKKEIEQTDNNITEVLEHQLPEQQEKAKIKAAITTDFILSIEIVIIALGTVLKQPLNIQIVTVCIVSVLATVGVYGIVALIVRMDDAGFKLIDKSNNRGVFSKIGHFLVKLLPVVIKILGVVGTIALLLVSGGIFLHNIDYFHHLFPNVPDIIKEFGFGIVVGTAMVLVITLIQKIVQLARK